LKWVHDIAGVANPMINPFVKNIVEGTKRQHARPVVKKTPIFSESLKACCLKYEKRTDLAVRRDIAMAVLLFAGFFRYSEIASLSTKDISISDTHLTVQVTKSKTDQYRKGKEVVINRSNLVTCPVSNLERYIALASINISNSSDYLFKPVVKSKSGLNSSLLSSLILIMNLSILLIKSSS